MLYGILNQIFDITSSLIFLLNAKIKLLKMLQLHQQGNCLGFAFQTLKIYCKLSTQKILLILSQKSVFGR